MEENKCTYHPTNLNMGIPDEDCEVCMKEVNEIREAVKDIKFPVIYNKFTGHFYDSEMKIVNIHRIGHKIAEFINSLNK